MAQLLVRNVEDSVKTELQARAARHGQSMEEEIREILRNAVRESEPKIGLGSQFAALFSEAGLTEEIQELRGYTIEPVTFEDDHS